ncbi:MAG: SsrA-binding protein [Candidatus Gottesmanbacteria bacterium GW2011_GWB1_43_11]|uniref:SsrA-binding protein n=1 Tax=Candidatus Gottesmanbacteria bacterium GW2011_GWB1_43_11 TaxID=1618446 RepID=A0A0G1CLS7_9BACT|nr:MAG: SsrA-binding protein [Candidatus Gottesmanbacteria bacterium GW2011_GWA2_42_16]KKS81193.1 MAG: SsrA-binding protein [Candidatus Gottesmanbacteria bacterium GW2011_GWC1_43_10]KKS86452.1 MAG: SsrA-binding protein [Candidatus Gottesmanbacteria bacterium GW2011_GWB1_43_11]OGG10099.1 MAG: SsrA-binding protein [Candidatus Gottesmanbacteria bacterium RIFCSPHIGHO2_01_FULL_43_15]OGG25335.1 MAG: SsrA-binding protein [Candidatus Gottesmanbacteria bacterium RIFCSPLOWO2_01_FULL_42_10]HCM37435.1 Ssr
MKLTNRNAFHDYTILERFEAGIKLTGPEVKSVKDNRVSLTGAFVRVVGSEIYLINAQIQPYSFARVEGYDPRRTRKLLLGKREIVSLKGKLEGGGYTLIPLSFYTKHGLVKVEVGLGCGKKQFEKRELLKKRAQKREIERTYRGKVV